MRRIPFLWTIPANSVVQNELNVSLSVTVQVSVLDNEIIFSVSVAVNEDAVIDEIALIVPVFHIPVIIKPQNRHIPIYDGFDRILFPVTVEIQFLRGVPHRRHRESEWLELRRAVPIVLGTAGERQCQCAQKQNVSLHQ